MTHEQNARPPLEVNIRRMDGMVVTVVFTHIHVTFDGQPSILGTIIDITEHKRNEIELQKAHKLLQIQTTELEELRAKLKVK